MKCNNVWWYPIYLSTLPNPTESPKFSQSKYIKSDIKAYTWNILKEITRIGAKYSIAILYVWVGIFNSTEHFNQVGCSLRPFYFTTRQKLYFQDVLNRIFKTIGHFSCCSNKGITNIFWYFWYFFDTNL